MRRFVTIFDRAGPRVGFAVAKHSDDNTPAMEIISHVGSSVSDPGTPPAGNNAGAVDLHLDSGGMGPGQGDSSDDDSSPPPAPVPSPPPPPPAYVPPPSTPPAADATQSLDSSDPFGLNSNSHFAAWSSDDSVKKVSEATPAPVVTEAPSLWRADSDYEKTLLGDSAATPKVMTPFDEAQKLIDANTAATQKISSPFDDAQKLIDANSAAAVQPAVSKPEPSYEAPVSHPVDANAWMKAFEEPSAPATQPASKPFEMVKAASASADDAGSHWSSRWGSENTNNDIEAALGIKPEASQTDAAPQEPKKAAEDDAIARMRRLFKQNSLLQKQKRGHMVSVKLYRGH